VSKAVTFPFVFWRDVHIADLKKLTGTGNELSVLVSALVGGTVFPNGVSGSSEVGFVLPRHW